VRALSLPSKSPLAEKSKWKVNFLSNRYKDLHQVPRLAFRGLLACSLIATTILVQGAPMSEAAGTSIGVKKLLWSEEFKGKAGASVDSKTWKFDLGDGSDNSIPGWGNSEREYYTTDAAKLDGSKAGGLTITAERPNPENPPICYYGECEWTSARINTIGKVLFKYGYIEARIKFPEGGGTWPAFWALGTNITKGTAWPECGEIDIAEAVGNNPLGVYGTLHGPGYSGGEGITRTTYLKKPVSSDYHLYAVNWTSAKIEFLVDGKVYHSVTKKEVSPNKWPFDQDFFLILNLAMGGNLGQDIDPELKKATMQVDYIKYYSVNGVGKVTKLSGGKA
jgi:beta-glucanase (GH16 family)